MLLWFLHLFVWFEAFSCSHKIGLLKSALLCQVAAPSKRNVSMFCPLTSAFFYLLPLLSLKRTNQKVDVQLSDVLDNSPTSEPTFAKKLRPLPPIWERGISLAALQLFAAEMVSSDAVPTSSVVAALRQRLAKSGRRTALVGLLADCGLRTLVRQRPRLVDEWGIEYDDPSSLHHHPSEYPEVEVVVAATGQPNLFLSHAWSGSFHDSIAACVAWCGQQQPEPLNPAAVYVWMDAFCLDQWTEVTGAVGNVVVGNSSGNGNSSSSSGASALAGTANGSSGGAGSSTFHARLANESSIVEGFVFAVRACGSTVCVASPGRRPGCRWQTLRASQRARRVLCRRGGPRRAPTPPRCAAPERT